MPPNPRPVFGVFSFDTKNVDKEKRDQCIERLIAKMKQGEQLGQQAFPSSPLQTSSKLTVGKPDQEIKKIFQDADLLS